VIGAHARESFSFCTKWTVWRPVTGSPEPDQESEEWRRYLEQHPEVVAAWDKLGISEADIYTDYITVVD
jgi:hypothetical protein